MISDFFSRNNNFDALILIIIGIALPTLSKKIFNIIKKIFIHSKLKVRKVYKFFNRRLTGNYNLRELEVILKKPEAKRSEKEKIAVDRYKESQRQLGEAMKGIRVSIKLQNDKIKDIKNNWVGNKFE